MQSIRNFFTHKSNEKKQLERKNPLLNELLKMCTQRVERREKIDELCQSKGGIKKIRAALHAIPALKEYDGKMHDEHDKVMLTNNFTQSLSAEQAYHHMKCSEYYRTEVILANELAGELRAALQKYDAEPRNKFRR